MARVGWVLFLALLLLFGLCGIPEAPAVVGDECAPLEELQRQADELQRLTAALEQEERVLSQQFRAADARADALESSARALAGILALLNPLRLFSPLLANGPMLLAAVALLIFLLRWPNQARAVLTFPSAPRVPAPPLQQFPGRVALIVIIVLAILLLTGPVWAQEHANTQEPGASPTPTAPSLSLQLEEAAMLADLSVLARTIYLLERARPGVMLDVLLDDSIVIAIECAAERQGHPPLIKREQPPRPVALSLREGGFAFHLVRAAVYEAAGRAEVLPELSAAIDALQLEQSPDTYLPYARLRDLTLWLLSLEAQEYARRLLPAVGEAAGDYAEVAELVELTRDHGFVDLAPGLVEIAIRNLRGDSDLALRLVTLLHQLGDTARAEGYIDEFIATASGDLLLTIADTAASLEMHPRVETALLKLTRVVEAESAVEKLLFAAERYGLLEKVARELAARCTGGSAIAQFQVQPQFNPALGAERYLEESAMLQVVAATWLYGADRDLEMRALLQEPVAEELDGIILSAGAAPAMNLNHICALARFYEVGKDPGSEAAARMVTIQRRLRGLEPDSATADDARRAALQMQIEQLQESREDMEAAVAQLKSGIEDAQARWRAAVWRNVVLIGEAAAKAFLLLIALRIILVRAITAMLAASRFRFSHFIWAALETIGFIACCTVVGLPFGIVMALIAQDRLKHLSLAESIQPPRMAPAPAQQETDS